ncbi:hypothetical protein NHX12_014315, partial [Muraenolepis orangiensis]
MAAGDGAQLPATIAASRSVEKALEEAAASGALHLANRKLKEFPRTARNHDLSSHVLDIASEMPRYSVSGYDRYGVPSDVVGMPWTIDASCNDLQALPAELGQLESLRDLNLRRNQLASLPDELSELPLVRLDLSCNRISHVPVCYRHLRHLQSFLLEGNPLQLPPAQVCSRGKYHIFKHLHLEACRRSQEELERQLRPTGFASCLSDQELFQGQFGGLDSGFNSVDSGSKRWSGNESADDFSERSLRMAEVEKNEEKSEKAQTRDPSPSCRLDVRVEVSPSSSGPSSPSSPSSPSAEEKRRPGTLLIWQERERQQRERERARDGILLKSSPKTGSLVASTLQTGNGTGGVAENSHNPVGLRQRCVSAEHMSASHSPTPIQRSVSRTDVPSSPKTSPPGGHAQKPNSFLFRATSRVNCKTTGSFQNLGEYGRSESRTTLSSPRDHRPEVLKLRKTLESRLKVTLPEDLGEALSDGTILCQLANQIRPRSVPIIHVPSPAVPKLSSAKSRLNLENFITACCKLGVPETEMCVCSDVLLCKLPAVLRCFLLFYGLLMAVLCALYRLLL